MFDFLSMAQKIRTQNPPVSTHYKPYKVYLRVEFDHRCAYCNIHEAEGGGSSNFHIDHYYPKSQFPDKVCDYFNLFYSCPDCNRLKGAYYPSESQEAAEEYILNPCDHDYEVHYDRTKAEWIPNTPTATWNIERLRLNSNKQVNVRIARNDLLNLIKVLSKRKAILESMLKIKNLNQSVYEEIENNIKELERLIASIEFKILTPLD